VAQTDGQSVLLNMHAVEPQVHFRFKEIAPLENSSKEICPMLFSTGDALLRSSQTFRPIGWRRASVQSSASCHHRRLPIQTKGVDAPSRSVNSSSRSTFVRTEFNSEAVEHRFQPDDGNHAKKHSSEYVARIIQADYKSADCSDNGQ
jgi:hypothetical protein